MKCNFCGINPHISFIKTEEKIVRLICLECITKMVDKKEKENGTRLK